MQIQRHRGQATGAHVDCVVNCGRLEHWDALKQLRSRTVSSRTRFFVDHSGLTFSEVFS
jgi:hypothetical protein